MILIYFANIPVHLHAGIQAPVSFFFYSEQLPVFVQHYCQPPGNRGFKEGLTMLQKI